MLAVTCQNNHSFVMLAKPNINMEIWHNNCIFSQLYHDSCSTMFCLIEQWLLEEMENVALLTILKIIYSGTTVIITSSARFYYPSLLPFVLFSPFLSISSPLLQMSLMEHGGGAHNRPVTAVAWASNSSTCPKDFNLVGSEREEGRREGYRQKK